jgi:hypothetical protein
MSSRKRRSLYQELHGVTPSSRRIILFSKSETRRWLAMQHMIQSKNIWENSSGALGFSQRIWNGSFAGMWYQRSFFWRRTSIEAIDHKRSTGVDWGELANPWWGIHDDRSQSAKSGSLASTWWSESPQVKNDFEFAWIGLKIQERMAQNRVDWRKRSPIVTSHKRVREPSLRHSLERRMSFHIIDGSNRENGIIYICGSWLTERCNKDTFQFRWIKLCERLKGVACFPYMERGTNYSAKQSNFFKSCLVLPDCAVSTNVRFRRFWRFLVLYLDNGSQIFYETHVIS